MANVAEMQIFNDAMGDLSRTLMQNKAMKQQRAEREAALAQQDRQRGDQVGLEREMMGLREKEFGLRQEERGDVRAHRETLAQIQKESKELQERHYRMMQASGLLKQLQDGLASGTIKPDALKAQMADNPLLKELGLGVDIFQAPPAEGPQTPQPWKHPDTGENFAYNPRTGNFEKSTKPGGGRMKITPGEMGGPPSKTIEKDLTAEDLEAELKGMAPPAAPGRGSVQDRIKAAKAARIQGLIDDQIKQLGTGDERGPLGGSRMIKVQELERELEALNGGGTPAAGNPPEPQPVAPGIDEDVANRIGQVRQPVDSTNGAARGNPPAGEELVKVVSPTGKRGTVPKSQLEQAKREGYRVIGK